MGDAADIELREGESAVVLNDGRTAVIRAIHRGDAELLEAALQRLSPTSRYRRFMTGVSQLTDAEVEYLTDVDGVDHAAFGAGFRAADGSDDGIGVARYIRSTSRPTEADFAVTVIDEYQRLGVATILLDVLSRHALENGIRRLTGEMLAENLAVQQLIRCRGGQVVTTDDPKIVHGLLDLEEDATSG